jgi:hypothetical protein
VSEANAGPAGEHDRSLDVAAWHLQMLLASVASFDGKIMFLTALNVAGMSALIGTVLASDPYLWLIALGFVLLSICAALGLGVLWSANLEQFPSPPEITRFIREIGGAPGELTRRHFAAIQHATSRADDALRLRILTMRTLLVLTPTALTVVIATAVTTVN